ncbi:MAG: FkbM family methyltransferase [Alphaproteobacteria bacterium]|nr:FkbM family methyltransferase [Alphaproteobacteria bacterium]
MSQAIRTTPSAFTHAGTPRGIDALARFRRAILFGAGASVGEVRKVLDRYGIAIAAFADNSPAKQGTSFEGAPILAPATLPGLIDDTTCIVIASVYQTEIAEQLAGFGIPADVIFPFVSPMFAGHFGGGAFTDAEALARLPARLADDESRAYLAALIDFRWTMEPARLRRNPRLKGFYQYDGPFVGPLAGDHIVDVGAYNGDSATAYLERLNGNARVSGLEPLPQNLKALAGTIAAHRFGRAITPVPFGAGAAPASAEIDSEDEAPDARATLRRKPGATTTIRIETLDRLFAADRVDFIKIDIEGHDPAALMGARELLARDKPGLAVAAYHAPEHLWEIPALLDRLCPGYRIHLGHHPAAAYECELFCVHESRVGA